MTATPIKITQTATFTVRGINTVQIKGEVEKRIAELTEDDPIEYEYHCELDIHPKVKGESIALLWEAEVTVHFIGKKVKGS